MMSDNISYVNLKLWNTRFFVFMLEGQSFLIFFIFSSFFNKLFVTKFKKDVYLKNIFHFFYKPLTVIYILHILKFNKKLYNF